MTMMTTDDRLQAMTPTYGRVLTKTETLADGALYPRMWTPDQWSDPMYDGNSHAEAQAAGIPVCWETEDFHVPCVACEVEDGRALMVAPDPMHMIRALIDHHSRPNVAASLRMATKTARRRALTR